MFCTLVLLPILCVLGVNAFDFETLPEILKEHSNALNQFQLYLEKTESLENHVSSLEPNVTVAADQIDNLKKELANLTVVSSAYTEKLNSFELYQNRTDKLQGQVFELHKTVRSYQRYVDELEEYKKNTNELEGDIVQIKDSLNNSSSECSTISQNLRSFYQTCKASQDEVQLKLNKIPVMERQQQEIDHKFQEVVKAIDAERRSSLEKITSLMHCVVEQQKIAQKLHNLDDLPKVQNETTKKLNDFIEVNEKQSEAMTKRLKALQDNVDEQSKTKKELQKINELTNAQEDIARKLDQLSNLFDQVTSKQQILQISLTQLSNELQGFLTASTTTLTPPTTTADPNNIPRVIRKRVHARGNNIVITV